MLCLLGYKIMETKIQHLLYVPFLGLGKINRGNDWLEKRIKIFKQFVLPSLINQTNRNFILWISWRPEDADNELVKDLIDNLRGIESIRGVFTFGGLCFWDDKFSDEEASNKLLTNLKNSLPILKPYVDWADEVYMTIQPSDDMYINSAIETIQNTDFDGNKAIGWTKGYIMNYATKEVAEYNPDTLPPFATIRFPKEVFLNPFEHFDWAGPYRSHEYVKDLGFKELPGRGFVVGCHGENISTSWTIPYKGNIVDNRKVLLQVGAYFTEPLIMKPSRRVRLRNIYNKLPFKKVIKYVWKAFTS